MKKVTYTSTESSLTRTQAKENHKKVIIMRDSIKNDLSFPRMLQDFFDISDAKAKVLRREKAAIKQNRTGNCGDFASLALYFCKKHNCPAENILLANADHEFVVINRLPDSDINDPSTWGEDAIICDPFYKKVYYAKLFREHLMGYDYNEELEHPNLDIPNDEIIDPEFEIVIETKNENLSHTKEKYLEAKNQIQHLKTFLEKIKMTSHAKNEIYQLIDQFKTMCRVMS